MANYSRWDRGDWEAICDSCGRKFKASKLKMRWDGLMVCAQDWEARQPQDFVRGVPDPQLVPWVRDEAKDKFKQCTTDTSLAGLAIAGCAIPANIINPGIVPPSSFNGNTL